MPTSKRLVGLANSGKGEVRCVALLFRQCHDALTSLAQIILLGLMAPTER